MIPLETRFVVGSLLAVAVALSVGEARADRPKGAAPTPAAVATPEVDVPGLERDLAARNAELERQAGEEASRTQVEMTEAARRADAEAALRESADARLRAATSAEEHRIVRKSIGVYAMPAGVIVAGIGTGLLVAALNARASVENGGLQTGGDIDSALQTTKTLSPVGVTLIAVGAIVAAGGGVLFFTARKSSVTTHGGDSAQRATPALQWHGTTLVW